MRRTSLILSVCVAAALAGCSTTPDRIDEIETARSAVTRVESSPRAGVAAEQVSAARKALTNAERMAERGGKLEDIRWEASVATRNAEIASEKIAAAQAREEIEQGNAERQRIVAEAREREARAREAEAQLASAQAREAQERANSLEEELRELRAKPTDRGMVLTLGDVLFDTGKSTLKPGAYQTIERVATLLKESPERKVMIEGHTDSVGSEEFNMGLSQRRAQSVQAALMERGVPGNQISATGRGESTPVASNDDPGGRQQNRRVELIFEQAGSRVASDGD
jgi:outer membrane protein OmpA-like peptidoglycan-associated protein